MKKWKVTIYETLIETDEIEAETAEEAERIAWERLDEGYYDINEIDGHDVKVSGEAKSR